MPLSISEDRHPMKSTVSGWTRNNKSKNLWGLSIFTNRIRGFDSWSRSAGGL